MRGIALAAIAALAFMGGQVAAQDYPTKPITLVVPYPAGGGQDVGGRVIAEYLTEHLGVNVIVENKPGAASQIGIDYVAKSPPDGYMLGYANSDGLSVMQAVKNTMPYAVPDDFDFIGQVVSTAHVISVSAKSPFKTIQELIAYAKDNPGKLKYGTQGIGSAGHLAAELFMQSAGIKMTHVPFQGSAPAVTAAVGGFVDFVVAGPPSIEGFVQSGDLRPLVTFDKDRHWLYPDMPTMTDIGLPDATSILSLALLAPRGVPEPILQKLRAAMMDMVAQPEMIERFRAIGVDPKYVDGVAFGKIMADETTAWEKLVESAGIPKVD